MLISKAKNQKAIRICSQCGEDISLLYHNRKYCIECSKKRDNESKRRYATRNYDKVKAIQIRNDKKKKEKRASNPKMFVCVVCGKIFRKMSNKKHCSRECRNVTRARRQKLTYNPNNGRNGLDIVCVLCGETITKNAYNQKYCDDCQKKMACHYERRRNLIKKNVDGTHTKDEFNDLCNRMNWKCAYCGKELNVKIATEDHIVPLVHGGSDNISNIALACLSCNCSKSDSSVYDFMKRKQCSLEI